MIQAPRLHTIRRAQLLRSRFADLKVERAGAQPTESPNKSFRIKAVNTREPPQENVFRLMWALRDGDLAYVNRWLRDGGRDLLDTNCLPGGKYVLTVAAIAAYGAVDLLAGCAVTSKERERELLATFRGSWARGCADGPARTFPLPWDAAAIFAKISMPRPTGAEGRRPADVSA